MTSPLVLTQQGEPGKYPSVPTHCPENKPCSKSVTSGQPATLFLAIHSLLHGTLSRLHTHQAEPTCQSENHLWPGKGGPVGPSQQVRNPARKDASAEQETSYTRAGTSFVTSWVAALFCFAGHLMSATATQFCPVGQQ